MKKVARLYAGMAVLGLGGVGLVGCSTPVYNVEYDDTYRAGETKVLPEIPVVVRGSPFGLPQAQFDSDVVNTMQGWSGSGDRFTATGDPNSPYRVVMVFNPVSNSYTASICDRPIKAEAAPGAASSSTVQVAAVLCRGGNYLSYAWGYVPVTAGPDSPDFRQGIQQATTYLFPVQNPTANGARGCDHC